METALEQSGLRSVSAAEARALLKEQQGGDQSIAAFARDRGIHPWSLYNANATDRRRKARRAKQCFVPVTIAREATAQASAGSAGIEISLPSGLSLRLEAGFDEVALRRLIGILATC